MVERSEISLNYARGPGFENPAQINFSDRVFLSFSKKVKEETFEHRSAALLVSGH